VFNKQQQKGNLLDRLKYEQCTVRQAGRQSASQLLDEVQKNWTLEWHPVGGKERQTTTVSDQQELCGRYIVVEATS